MSDTLIIDIYGKVDVDLDTENTFQIDLDEDMLRDKNGNEYTCKFTISDIERVE